MRMRCLAPVQLMNQAQMPPACNRVHAHANYNERGSEPQRESGVLCDGGILRKAELLQEEAESRNHESESHHCQPCADPCQQRALGGEIIAQGRLGSGRFRTVHLSRIPWGTKSLLRNEIVKCSK